MAATASVASSPPFTPPKSEHSVKGKADILYRSLMSSSLFSVEKLQEISEWKIDFDSVDKTVAPRRLCFLLCKIVRPALAVEKDSTKQVKLFSFEENITEILGLLLSENQTPEEVIEDYQINSEKQALFFKKVALIEAFYQKQLGLLTAEANRLNEDLRVKLEAFKNRVQEINKFRIDKSDELTKKLDMTVKKADEISKELLKDSQEIETLATQYSEQQTALKNLLKEAEQVIAEAKNERG